MAAIACVRLQVALAGPPRGRIVGLRVGRRRCRRRETHRRRARSWPWPSAGSSAPRCRWRRRRRAAAGRWRRAAARPARAAHGEVAKVGPCAALSAAAAMPRRHAWGKPAGKPMAARSRDTRLFCTGDPMKPKFRFWLAATRAVGRARLHCMAIAAAGRWPRPGRRASRSSWWRCFRPAARSTRWRASWRQPLSQQLGQSVIVENKGGASGTIGTARGGRRAAGRLHLRRGVRHPRRQSQPDPRPALRHAQGPGAGGADGHRGDGAGHPCRLRVQDLCRRGRRRQGRQGRRATARIGSGSLGHLAMALLAQLGRPEPATHALQGRRTADERRGGRSRAAVDRFGVPGQAAHRQQAPAAAGRHHQQARAGTARRADAGRKRLSRLRRAGLVGGAGAGQDAARDRASA